MAEPKALIVKDSPTAVAVVTTGDKWTLCVAHPMVITQIGIRMTAAATAGSLVLAFDRVPANNGTRVDGDIGILSKGYASLATIGKVLKKDVCVKVDKGDLIIAEVTTALTTNGTCYFYVLGYAAGEGAVEYDRATPPVAITVDSD